MQEYQLKFHENVYFNTFHNISLLTTSTLSKYVYAAFQNQRNQQISLSLFVKKKNSSNLEIDTA